MIFGKIVGTVVSTKMEVGIKGRKCLLVQTCNHKGEVDDDYLVAVDLVAAGVEEIVLISQGSSARQTKITHQKPVDCVIVGIVDMVEEYNQVVFKK